mmetsp:Transcript_19401/g.48569  ORF Transcript_19401/g.48569 Transcript_19401/m.48569 type:complete len:346 (-) Transcript_19401:1165-2202(-)
MGAHLRTIDQTKLRVGVLAGRSSLARRRTRVVLRVATVPSVLHEVGVSALLVFRRRRPARLGKRLHVAPRFRLTVCTETIRHTAAVFRRRIVADWRVVLARVRRRVLWQRVEVPPRVGVLVVREPHVPSGHCEVVSYALHDPVPVVVDPVPQPEIQALQRVPVQPAVVALRRIRARAPRIRVLAQSVDVLGPVPVPALEVPQIAVVERVFAQPLPVVVVPLAARAAAGGHPGDRGLSDDVGQRRTRFVQRDVHKTVRLRGLFGAELLRRARNRDVQRLVVRLEQVRDGHCALPETKRELHAHPRRPAAGRQRRSCARRVGNRVQQDRRRPPSQRAEQVPAEVQRH